jgi:hypothetical protein
MLAPTLEELTERAREESELALKLIAEDPGLPFLSAMVVAGDLLSAERAWKLIEMREMPFDRARVMVGSYAWSRPWRRACLVEKRSSSTCPSCGVGRILMTRRTKLS